MSGNKNIYQKLSEAREKIHNVNLNKTGKNKHLNFEYYTLDDILPMITRIENELQFNSQFSFLPEQNIYTLTITNNENISENIVFSFPNALYGLTGAKGTNPEPENIQNKGAINTYIRRYLLLIAYNISEPDSIDDTNNTINNTTSKHNNNTNKLICKACNAPIKQVTLTNGKKLNIDAVYKTYKGHCYDCAKVIYGYNNNNKNTNTTNE